MTATIATLGDSQTDYAAGYGVRPSRCWTSQLGTLLQAEGVNARARGFGVAGDTTATALARADAMLYNETPDLGVIYLGVNDPVNSISQATTQANLQAAVKMLKYGAVGAGYGAGVTVADQTALPATGKLGQRYVVLSDTSITGGAAAWHASHAATITGASSGQTVWEFRYPQVGERGWGRVATAATAPTKCKRIVVLSTNYLNFTTGGDTPSTPYATYAPVRTAQQAAVTAENVAVSGVASVVYADLYNLMLGRIQAGTDPDFSSVSYDQTKSWHYTQNNQHHNTYGHTLVAQAVRTAMPSQWVTALAAL